MRQPIPLVVLLVLLAAQSALLVFNLQPAPLGGDEPYYFAKAKALVEEGRFPRARAEDLVIEAGAPGVSDWRPQGYPAFVALVSGGDFDVAALRRRVAFAQLALVVAAVLTAWTLVPRTLVSALVLGIAPWPFAFVTRIMTDSLNAVVAFFALVLLYRWVVAKEGRTGLLLAGSLLSAATLLVRPEMAAIAVLPIAVALLLRWRQGWVQPRHLAAAAAALLLVVGLQYAYRVYFTGRMSPSLFGGLHIHNRGTFAWANTWLGTEHEGYDFVYAISAGDTTARLPARAFASDAERRTVEALRARVRAEGFTPEVDRAFGELAARRIREHPFMAGVLPRLWHCVHVWVNTETNEQLLQFLSSWPRSIRRPLLGALLLLKLALVGLFAWRVLRWPPAPLVAMMGSFVLARTVLVGLVLNWMVNRYMVVAWLPLIVTALANGKTDDGSR